MVEKENKNFKLKSLNLSHCVLKTFNEQVSTYFKQKIECNIKPIRKLNIYIYIYVLWV